MLKTYVFLPPLKTPTGGLAVMHQVAGHLMAAGREVFLVPREREYTPWPTSAEVPVVHWDDLALTPDDIWLVPEGWVNALAPGLQAGAKTVVYVQNWAYLFSALPPGVTWDKLDVSFLAVSDPVAWFIEQSLGVRAPILRPGIDLERFQPPRAREAAPVRVAYMPRKNKALAAQIRAMFEARQARNPHAPRVIFEAIAGQDQDGVATILRRSHIFLATGFPEGCPLPPLEALASGCLGVGYGGFGGFDYMRQAADIPGAARPWFPLRETAWEGNGLWAADADIAGAVRALEEAVSWIPGDDRYLAAVAAARATAQAYSTRVQAETTLAVWAELDG